jgi:hypothetical protein
MANAVYCLASTEPQANEILTHLRNLGFSSAEISILLTDNDTRNISVKEDAVRGAATGGIAGGILGALGTILLTPLGPLVVAGPIVSAIGGAVAGGVVGGLAGGSGALARIGIPQEAIQRTHDRLQAGAILIAVHTDDPVRRDRALRVFKSSGAEEIYSSEDRAA